MIEAKMHENILIQVQMLRIIKEENRADDKKLPPECGVLLVHSVN